MERPCLHGAVVAEAGVRSAHNLGLQTALLHCWCIHHERKDPVSTLIWSHLQRPSSPPEHISSGLQMVRLQVMQI